MMKRRSLPPASDLLVSGEERPPLMDLVVRGGEAPVAAGSHPRGEVHTTVRREGVLIMPY
jgi:hypothetical protein